MRIDIYAHPKDFYWLSCELMDSQNFPKLEQQKQVPGKATIRYANTINETANAHQQIILIAYFESIEYSTVYEFANWLYSKLRGTEIKTLQIEKKPVQLQLEDIVRAIMIMNSKVRE